ncbi:hypothetical protein J2Z21_008167 [Streptomyces griseochromogenes]|uniref:Uncharacterized protein n=1 Tax=Streptomyces griseochromogenes TaxID=68214 RepID=A0ABS4M653_9ACTN|nr:hypothetical protein [Streptomyces griseochromogenes]
MPNSGTSRTPAGPAPGPPTSHRARNPSAAVL